MCRFCLGRSWRCATGLVWGNVARPVTTESAEWAETARSGSVAPEKHCRRQQVFVFFLDCRSGCVHRHSDPQLGIQKISIGYGPTNSLRSWNSFRVIPPFRGFRDEWPPPPDAAIHPAHAAPPRAERDLGQSWRPLTTESAEWAESARSGSVAPAMHQDRQRVFFLFLDCRSGCVHRRINPQLGIQKRLLGTVPRTLPDHGAHSV